MILDQLAMANSVRWYGHVLRRGGGHILRSALDFEVDALCRSKWSVGENKIDARLR